MPQNNISKVGYLVGGMGVGSLIGILFAPKSGDQTREYLANKAKQGREFAQKQVWDLKDRADELVQCGKDGIAAKREQIATAVNVGRQAYRRDLAKKRI
jgi:gas vesicle protein